MASVLSKEELTLLVENIMEGNIPPEYLEATIQLLRENVPDPKVTDYIFWSEPKMTPEEIVEKACRYQP